RPRLLVLDDATSAVDPRVEAAILAGLRRSGSGTTVVVVAYRKATIALADEMVLLLHGRIVARGTHAELSARDERYRTLVDADEREAAERAAELAAQEADEAAELAAEEADQAAGLADPAAELADPTE